MRVEPEAAYKFFGQYEVNLPTLTFSMVAFLVLAAFGYFAGRRLNRFPGKGQVLVEMFVAFFDGLCRDALGERGRKYVPYIGSLFMFLWLSNAIGIVPFFQEPTRDINTPVALAAVAIVVSQVSAIRVNGFKKWFMDLCEPAPRILGIPFPLLLPLNIVGEIGKAISLPFRLFGNIFGGAVIILVVSTLTLHIGLPAFLNLFFGLFVGTIQALVFTMLALTYIAVAIGGEEEEFEDEAMPGEPARQ